MRLSPLFCALSVSLPLAAAEVPITRVEARIYPLAREAQAVEAMAYDAEGRVLAIGSRAEVDAAIAGRGEIRTLKLDGVVVPGLIDAHAHLLGLGFSLLQADLVDAADVPEVIARLQRQAEELPAGAWLTGRGWDQNDWPEQSFPTAAMLDAAFPERPVWLERIDGHAGWANSRALAAAGIDADTPDPEGGKILRDAEGRATGVLIDAAMGLVDRVLPKPDRALKRKAAERALAQAASLGLTGVHDAGMSWDDLSLFREIADAGQLPLRIYAMADGDNLALRRLCQEGLYSHRSGRLQMRALKLYADGALGSRGAALLRDYSDDPGNRGLLFQSQQVLDEVVRRATDCGVQVAVHAIGDAGNRQVIAAYAKLAADMRERLRLRIEHAQVIAPEDIPRFAELKLIASMQPTHATSDMPWAEARVGAERIRGAYAWQTLLKLDVPLALGSDFPVERVAPTLGLYAAIARQDQDGQPTGGWFPDQRLSRAEALHGFTLAAAHAGFAEAEIGSLEPGKRADYTLFAADPYTAPISDLASLKVLGTWIDGERVSGE